MLPWQRRPGSSVPDAPRSGNPLGDPHNRARVPRMRAACAGLCASEQVFAVGINPDCTTAQAHAKRGVPLPIWQSPTTSVVVLDAGLCRLLSTQRDLGTKCRWCQPTVSAQSRKFQVLSSVPFAPRSSNPFGDPNTEPGCPGPGATCAGLCAFEQGLAVCLSPPCTMAQVHAKRGFIATCASILTFDLAVQFVVTRPADGCWHCCAAHPTAADGHSATGLR